MTLSRELAAAMCESTTLEDFKLGQNASVHEVFFSTLAEKAEKCMVRIKTQWP